MAPLGLATLAALTPDDVEVDIWDEGVDGLVTEQTRFEKGYDLVGVTGYENHAQRMEELGRFFRSQGVLVAVGGPAVSASPEHYRDHFDILFIGEAEYTWPRFIAEWKAGSHRREYRQVNKVDMTDSPLPRWDKVRTNRYFVGGVQTTRGCPFDCEFCDVIYIYGRQARHKSIAQVLEEVRALEKLGARAIFFCDDNFIGNPGYTKALLKELIPVNRSFRQPIDFFTQITLNVAKDDDLLESLAEANFAGMFIGIETPNIESLIESNKPQNYRTDIVEDVKKIQSYGIPIRAGMIVGFDHDDTSIFRSQFEFLQEAAIAIPFINTLKAPAGTKLWVRLHREGRVVEFHDQATTTGDRQTAGSEFLTNILPKRMTRIELLAGYRDLMRQVRDWDNFETRVKLLVSRVRRPPADRVSWQGILLALYVVLFHFDRHARRATVRLALYTLRHSPSMLNRVLRLVWNQYIEAVRLPMLLEGIDEQIRRETETSHKLRPAATVFLVPDAFKKPYRAFFPELYQRVYLGLEDKSRIHDALTEVTYDFLTRWGPSFEEFEEHHRSFLYELCDRTLAKENGDVPAARENGALPIGPADGNGNLSEGQAGVRLKRLADEVLRVVEQDLRSFQPQPSI
jgi:radical SAM superfamily enzyme YgiQ (UPF0313 family)